MIENIFSARDFVHNRSLGLAWSSVLATIYFVFQNGHSLMPYFIIPSPIIPAGMNVFMVSVMVLSIRSLT